MALVLIGSAQRFRSMRNVWMLEELAHKVTFEHIPARPASDEAKAHNPFGKIPVLLDGDLTMYDSAAINTYLGDKYGALVPNPGTKARGKYEQLVHTLQCELDAQGLWVHRKHDQLAHIFGANPEAVAQAKRHARKVVAVVARECMPGPYLLGEDFSAADILFTHCLEWAHAIGWASWDTNEHETQSHLTSYLERCKSRPAFQRTLARK